jgi:flagellar motility protein MotE (MotC chaperone)
MVNKFYLSRILGNKIFSEDRKYVGKLQDLVAEINGAGPRVIAAKVNTGKETKYIDFSTFNIGKEKNHYNLSCREVRDRDISKENTVQLAHHILDRQIVDVNGRKVVRVNDIGCALIKSGEVMVIAVDVGLEGLLRRLGCAKIIKNLLKLFRRDLGSNLILWENVQAIMTEKRDIKLSKSYKKLSTLHPSDLADIIEDLDKKSQAQIFASLDEEKAADVLEELETDAQLNILNSMSVEKAADVLEKMPADEVADILDDLKEEHAEKLLNEMDREVSKEVKELMEYPDNTVGSIMSADLFYLDINFTVARTIEELRRLKPQEDKIYYLYITDEEQKLRGALSLRDLVIAEPDKKLSDILEQKIISVRDTDNLNSMINIISKYNLPSLPVIDDKEVMVGVVIVNDVVYELLKPERRRR